MHSRKKGKAGSNKPVNKTKPAWTPIKQNEMELLIVKLSKEGKSTSEIGIILRDNYGVPDARTFLGKKITAVLTEKGVVKELPENLMSLIRRSVQIRKHLEENHKDMPSKRGLQLTESKIKRLVKYYKEQKVLPLNWKYDAKSIRLYVE